MKIKNSPTLPSQQIYNSKNLPREALSDFLRGLKNYEICDVFYPENTYNIKAHRGEENEFFDCLPNTNIDGFPESEFYFSHVKDEILKEFTFKEPSKRIFEEANVLHKVFYLGFG